MNMCKSLVCVVLIAGCHGSSVPAGQPTPRASTWPQPLRTDPSNAVSGTARDVTVPDAVPPDVALADAALLDVSSPNAAAPSVVHDARSWLSDSDVVFHVTNDTGADVFIDDEHSLSLELRGRSVDLDPGCGSHCPSCACKECPYEPPRVRRIPNRGTWDDGWDRRIYVSQRCGGSCPCIRKLNAEPGTYTVLLRGKRRADAPPASKPLVYDGRLDERSIDCAATAIFRLKAGVKVELKLSCER